MYFVRSGFTDLSNGYGALRGSSDVGIWWSKTADDYTSVYLAHAFTAALTQNQVIVPSTYDRWYGFPLRCLAD